MNIAWLKVGHFFQVVWTWLKGNWMVVLLGGALVFALITAKGKADQYAALMKEFQDQLTHNHAELDQLRALQQSQIAQQQAINQHYNEVLDRIQHDYQSAVATLDANRRKELQNVIANTHDDPDEMARQVNALFGLPIYPLPTPATPPSH